MGREGFASKDVATDAGAAHVASPAGTTPRDLFWVFRSRMQQRDRSGRLWNHSAHDNWGRVESANSAAACCVVPSISIRNSVGTWDRHICSEKKLATALSAHGNLRGPRVLHRSTGEPLSQQTLRTWLSTAQKRAGLPVTGALHILRHTFCSHLAMRNAPALAIQQLAGHTSLRTTLRYMHLGPAEKDRAIRLLDEGRRASSLWRHSGDAAASLSKAPLPQGVN